MGKKDRPSNVKISQIIPLIYRGLKTITIRTDGKRRPMSILTWRNSMNSPANPQPSLGIPAGPLPSRRSGSKPVAAVIRPMPRETGKRGSLRLDSAESGQPPRAHVRKFELGDYVKWLKGKIEADRLDQREPNTELKFEATNLVESVTYQPVEPDVSSENPDTLFSTITDTDLVQVMEASPVKTPPPQGVRFEELPAVGFATDRFDDLEENSRIDASHGFESSAIPNSHIAFADEETDEVKISGKDTEEFISAVSKAIASVLTERTEPEFEAKVRSHFETELYARSIQALADLEEEEAAEQQEEVEAIETALNQAVADQEVEPETEEVSQVAIEIDQVASQIIEDSNKEIPTAIAAWDVEDFRWPLVTNQMIVTGAGAIDQLAQSAFSMLSKDRQRLAITGLGRDSGTSSIAITLGRWVAALGRKVLLIDADIAKPGLSKQVGLAPNLSWLNAVSQSLPASEVIVRSQKTNLCVMPLAKLVSRATWPRFIYDGLGELVDEVKDHFDLVIIDAGPSKQLLDELSRPKHLVDATLMVHDGVNSPEFRRAKNMLEGFGLNKFIVAKNRAPRQNINVA